MSLNQKIIKACEDYNKSFEKLCDLFIEKYFTYDKDDYAEYYIIWKDMEWYSHWPVAINEDMFYNIHEIREALYNNFDRRLVIDRADEQRDVQINFYNFCKYNKMQWKCTTKEIAESENKVKKVKKEFKKLITKSYRK